MLYYPRAWNANHGDDHLLSFCALTARPRGARLVREPCFKFWRPKALSRDGRRWRDARAGTARKHARSGVPENCTAGKYLAFHYVQADQQEPLDKRGGSPWR